MQFATWKRQKHRILQAGTGMGFSEPSGSKAFEGGKDFGILMADGIRQGSVN